MQIELKQTAFGGSPVGVFAHIGIGLAPVQGIQSVGGLRRVDKMEYVGILRIGFHKGGGIECFGSYLHRCYGITCRGEEINAGVELVSIGAYAFGGPTGEFACIRHPRYLIRQMSQAPHRAYLVCGKIGGHRPDSTSCRLTCRKDITLISQGEYISHITR